MRLEEQSHIVDSQPDKSATPSQGWFGDNLISNLCTKLHSYGSKAAKESKHILESATFWTTDQIDDVIKGVSNAISMRHSTLAVIHISKSRRIYALAERARANSGQAACERW
jgi:hypothetical protein